MRESEGFVCGVRGSCAGGERGRVWRGEDAISYTIKCAIEGNYL